MFGRLECANFLANQVPPVMLEPYFRRSPATLSRLKRSRFVADLHDLIRVLTMRGHAPRTIYAYVHAAAHLIRCFERNFIRLAELTEKRLLSFVREHGVDCRCPRPCSSGRNFQAVAVHFFQVMQKRHRIPAVAVRMVPADEVTRLLHEFDTFLCQAKGLREATRERYARDVRPLLASKFGHGPFDHSMITPAELREWVAKQAEKRAPRTANGLACALRSFLGFLNVTGRIGADELRRSVPSVRVVRLANVPPALTEQQLEQLRAVIDSSSPSGLRTAAMVQCMVILGLRAGEVAALLLDDIDWTKGIIHLHRSKGRRAAALPLPDTVGRSLTTYLKHGRPQTADRHVFVRHFMPVGGALRSINVSHSIGRALRRAGIPLPFGSAHALRHTAASRLWRAGATMKEVADLLRHRDLDTTRIYTKVDWAGLGEVALPWPLEGR